MKRFQGITSIKSLYQNINHKQTILKNTFWLTLAQGISGILNFLLIVYIIRTFGPTEYGKFAFALSFVFLFSILFDFGLSTVVTREFARDKDKEKYFSDVLALKIILGAGALTLVLVSSFLITPDKLVQKIILTLGFYIFIREGIHIFYALFRSKQKMEIEAFFRIFHIFILSIMVLGVLFIQPSVLNLSYAYLGSALFTLITIFCYLIFNNNFNLILQPSFNKPIWREFLVIGWYLALARGVSDITMYTDSVMLGYWGQVIETGQYNAASKINGMFLFPMTLVSAAIFPTLIIILRESKDRFIKYYEFWMKGTIFFSVLLCFMVLAKAREIIVIVYSSDFLPATLALKILVVMATIAYIHNIFFHVLLISDQQKRIFFVMLSGAVVNIILNLIMIPQFSLYGAAIAALITHLVILFQYFRLVSKYTIITPLNSEFFYTLSTAVLAGVSMYLSMITVEFMINTNLLLSFFSGVMLYSLFFIFFNKIVKIAIPLESKKL